MKWFRFFKRKKQPVYWHNGCTSYQQKTRGNGPQVLDDSEDFLLITWDSCRYDAFLQARTPFLDSLGQAERAGAMATYTLPAHVAMFQGFLPHVPQRKPLYNRFCQQLWRISHRDVGTTPLVTFPSRTPNIVRGFLDRGYYTVGAAAMPHFRDSEALRLGFQDFAYTGTWARKQNEFLETSLATSGRDKPWFVFVNYGETHSPFRHEDMGSKPDEVDARFDRRRLFNQAGLQDQNWQFDEPSFRRQVECAEFLDARVAELLTLVASRGRPTTVVVCADHGECCGENGLYGHALFHEKVMEVPLLIFRLNVPAHPLPAGFAPVGG
jgi:hypothetical protein